MNKSQILLESIQRLARRNAFGHVRRILHKSHASEIATVVRQLSDELGVMVMDQLRYTSLEAKAFAELGGTFLATYMRLRDDKRHASEILQQLPEDETARLLGALPEDTATEILTLMRSATQVEVEELLQYEEGSCGRIMSVNVFSLNQNLTARDAIEEIQKGSNPESLFYLYIVDDYENLVGVVSLRQILQVDGARRLKDFMTVDVIRVNVYQPQPEASRLVEEYNFVSIPAVDDQGRLMGMITVDDVIDSIRDEANDDVLQMAGVEAEAIDDFSYWRAGVSRATWYGLLLLCGVAVSEIVCRFVVLSDLRLIFGLAFLPLVLRLGGSTANQFITFIQQGIIDANIEKSRAISAVWGQGIVTIGTLMGLTGLVSAYVGLRFGTGFHSLAAFGISVLVTATFSMLAGLTVPFLFRRLKMNAVQASSRFFFFLDILNSVVFLSVLMSWQV